MLGYEMQSDSRRIGVILTRLVRVLSLVTVAVVGLEATEELHAQRSMERVLMLAPAPSAGVSPDFAIAFADEARKRMNSKFRNRLTVIPTDDICELLRQSAFDCEVILNDQDAERLARAMRADLYIVGTVWYDDAAPQGRFHLIDIGRSGVSGWMEVKGAPGDAPRRYADILADSLENQVRAGELARECVEKRDGNDYDAALQRARRVFEVYPNHPAAAQCAAYAVEAMGQPADSQIPYYERMVRGDSLQERAWQQLGRLHQEKGDSLKALEAFRRQLYLTPGDRQRWRGIVAGYMMVGEHAQARDLADEWLADNSDDVEFIQLKTRACFEGALWGCAVQGLAAQYGRDSALIGDSLFYQQIIAAAQADEDTDALLRWTSEAIRWVPHNSTFWRAHADALSEAGMADSAVAVYEHVVFQDPTDIATALLLSRRLIEGLSIDTVSPVDTTALLEAGEYLDLVVSQSQDTSVLMNAAVLFYQPAQQLVQTRQALPIAVSFLEKSLEADVLNRLGDRASFFLAWGLLYSVYDFDPQIVQYAERIQNLSAAERADACILVGQEEQMVQRGLEAIAAGASVSAAAAQDFASRFANFRQRIPTLREAFECRR